MTLASLTGRDFPPPDPKPVTTLQPRVFVLKRPRLPPLADARVGAFLLPNIESGFADAQLPADIRRRRPKAHERSSF